MKERYGDSYPDRSPPLLRHTATPPRCLRTSCAWCDSRRHVGVRQVSLSVEAVTRLSDDPGPRRTLFRHVRAGVRAALPPAQHQPHLHLVPRLGALSRDVTGQRPRTLSSRLANAAVSPVQPDAARLSARCPTPTAPAALPLPLCPCRSAPAARPLPLDRCRSAPAARPLPLCPCRSTAAALPDDGKPRCSIAGTLRGGGRWSTTASSTAT